MDKEFSAFLAKLKNSRATGLAERSLLVLKHRCKTLDAHVKRLFSNHDLQCYNVLYIGNVRLTTHSYSDGKTADDSSILFHLNGNQRFGRIQSIFTADNANPILFVAHLTDQKPLVCPLDDSHNVEFTAIQISTTTNWSYICVEIDDFIEKTTFFDTDDHQSCFCRFPTLTHSS